MRKVPRCVTDRGEPPESVQPNLTPPIGAPYHERRKGDSAPMKVNRRDWMIQTGVLAATSAYAQQQAGAQPWFDRPMRWVQLAFVEDDPGHYDPGFWLDYFKRIHADAICL